MIKLVDAQQMAKNYPETFSAPKSEELNQVKIGSSVKVCVNDEERLWLEVTSVSEDKLKGKIDNYPVILKGLSFGDSISFKKENIYDIFN